MIYNRTNKQIVNAKYKISSDSGCSSRSSINENICATPITIEKSKIFKAHIERYYITLFKEQKERRKRRKNLLRELMTEEATMEEKAEKLKNLEINESRYLRLKRRNFTVDDFQPIKVIGKGAFGEVRLVRKHDDEQYYAMKILKKRDMLERDQVAHVRAERDALTRAQNTWIVQMFFSFQDKWNLYIIMEFLIGGDFMSLLIKEDIIPESKTRFYIGELVLAITSIHEMGFIHRDIKPDNILLDEKGHIKLGDFGLCTGLRTAHKTKYYSNMENIDLKKLTYSGFVSTKHKALFKRNRRKLAFSTVGTPDYIAPEIFLQRGYNETCDWWSMGIIMYEMLYGYPPFCSSHIIDTYHKIMRYRETLKFPESKNVSNDAVDLLRRILCDADQRISTLMKFTNHLFFKGFPWDTIRSIVPPYPVKMNSSYDTGNFETISDSTLSWHQNDTPNSKFYDAEGNFHSNLPFLMFNHKSFNSVTKYKCMRSRPSSVNGDLSNESETAVIIDTVNCSSI